MKVPQTPDDLQENLKEQIAFLTSSAESFDKGDLAEAKRLAVSIRILFHDTKMSKSLLSQIGLKFKRNWLDTCFPDAKGNLLPYHGLVQLAIGNTPTSYRAPLDETLTGTGQFVDFNTWWTTTVIRDKKGSLFSRKNIVLSVSNVDGGAHVDPQIPESYHNLSRANSLGWNIHRPSDPKDTSFPILDNPALFSVRQIVHEVMRSLLPSHDYLSSPSRRPLSIKGPGRNDPCPCNSGVKFKKCHGV